MDDLPSAIRPRGHDARSAGRIALYAAAWFILLNALFAWVDPLPFLGDLTLYNRLYPGRTRLPYGEDPRVDFNVTVTQYDAVLSSHEIWRSKKPEGEFRVVMLGDSSVWGYLLPHDQTLSAWINRLEAKTRDGRVIRVYNLGYPTLSTLKDVLLLQGALSAEPDVIVWFVTLESLLVDSQMASPLLQFNPHRTQLLLEMPGLDAFDDDIEYVGMTALERTIIGRRSMLADMIRHQVLGSMWASTAVDRNLPPLESISTAAVPQETSYHDLKRGQFGQDDLAFAVLEAGQTIAGTVPVLLVNEPIFTYPEEVSPARYNPLYPRWTYDTFRQYLQAGAEESGWDLIDMWESIPPDEYADDTLHYNTKGAQRLAHALGQILRTYPVPSH